MEEQLSQDLLRVSFDNENGRYEVEVPQGSSLNETAFCIAVVIKCFVRDGLIEKEEMLELINKYLEDPQYQEVTS